MASASSVIRVSIVGDAKNLNKTLATVDTKISSIAKIGGGLAAGFVGLSVIDAGFSGIAESLQKADQFNDAFDDLAGTISPEFAQRVKDVAFDFTEIGLSADEVGTLSAHFANLATAAGVSAPAIATMTPDLLKIAAAIAATTGKTVDEVVDAIGKAASGNERPIRDLGIDLGTIAKGLSPDETLTIILQKLIDKFPDATKATDDLAGSQDELAAKIDNLQIKTGEALEGPLNSFVDWLNDMVEAAPGAFSALDTLHDKVKQLSPASFPNLGNLFDLLGDIIGRFTRVSSFQVSPGRAPGGGLSDRQLLEAIQREERRNSGPQGRD